MTTTTTTDDRLTTIHANIREQLERFLADANPVTAGRVQVAMAELVTETRFETGFVTRSQWTRIESGVA